MADDNGGPADNRKVGLPGRFLLRLINVVPDKCPREERTKFYLMSATVLLNAAAAAYTVPTGLSAAYPGLHGVARAGLALLGAGVVGVMDALIVGYWVSAARYRLSPPDQPPPLPSSFKRFGVFIPRLAFTAILVFGLGLLLTLSANTGVIAKQLAVDAIKDRNAAITTAQALDDRTIRADSARLRVAQARLVNAQSHQSADANRASCEAYGTPRVPKCSGHIGTGPIYREFYNRAKGSDQVAIRNDQAEVNSLGAELNSARADRLRQRRNKNVAQAAKVPTGLSAVRAAWDQYANAHGLNWVDRHLMDLLVLAVDIVPLGMKLLGGVSKYETDAWERDWAEGLSIRRRRQAEHKRLSVHAEFYCGTADLWRDSRLSHIQTWLDSEGPGDFPGLLAAPVPPQAAPDDPAPPAPAPFQPPRSWRPDDGRNPIREGRDARVGDVVPLGSGQYRLLAQITNRQSYNGDVFVAAQIRYPGQVAVAGRNIPIRALKFTRQGEPPSFAELEFLNRFPAPGETLLRTQAWPTANNQRLIYESPYFPRSDVMRYLYGHPRERYPRITVQQVIELMRSVNDAHRRIWEEGFLHNDTRLRNLIMTGPLEDGRENLEMLTPSIGRDDRDGKVLLCDWGSLSEISEPFDHANSVAASWLESDPALLRALLFVEPPTGGGPSPHGFASDQYSTFACAYQLLTGGISPTEGLLVYGYRNEPFAVAQLEAADDNVEPAALGLNGWPDALVEDPLPVRNLNPEVPVALAELIDAGVRANQLERNPSAVSVGAPLRAHEVARALEQAIDQMVAGLTMAELERQLPARHENYLWHLDAPVGWPPEVLAYVIEHWPEYGFET